MFWSLLLLPLLLVRGMLILVGNKVDIVTGAAIFTVFRLVISVFVHTNESGLLATLKLNNIKTYSSSPVILDMDDGTRLNMCLESELEENGIVSHMNMWPVITQNVDLVGHFVWQSRKLDSEYLGTCPCSISGFIPALSRWEMTSNGFTVVSLSSGIQWTMMEEHKLLMFDSEDSTLSKPIETCQEPQSVSGALLSTVPSYAHTVEPWNCEMKPEAHHMTDKLPSSSQCQKKMDESDKFGDEMADPSEATFQDQVNGGLLQRLDNNIKNHIKNGGLLRRLGNNIKNHMSHIGSGDNSEENNNVQFVSNIVTFFENNFWGLLSLHVLFLDGMIWQMLDIVIGAQVIVILGLDIRGIVESGVLATPILWYKFPILVYLIAYFLMFLSLILKCTPWGEWLSLLMAGAAYTSTTLGILLSIIVSYLPLEFARVCVSILVILLVLAMRSGYTPNGS